MLTYADIVSLPVTQTDILAAIAKARQCEFLDNLRKRHPNVQFDSKVRGYVGEIALRNWLLAHGIQSQRVNYLEDESGMDVDFLFTADNRRINLELKTSLIPDKWRTLPNCVQRGDIKLIRRGRQTIDQLKGDLHVQIYFRQRRLAKDRWLAQQVVDVENALPEVIYEKLLGRAYLDNVFLVGWIDKPALVAQLCNLPVTQATWRFSGSSRTFWKCSITQHARKPQELVEVLQKFKQDS